MHPTGGTYAFETTTGERHEAPSDFWDTTGLQSIDVLAIGKDLEVKISGKLTKHAYETFAPEVTEQIKKHGKLRILFQIHDFHGWTAGALWEDIKFDFTHWKDIERLAIVGDSKWEKGMAIFCKPFIRAELKYFDHADLDAARGWVTHKSSP